MPWLFASVQSNYMRQRPGERDWDCDGASRDARLSSGPEWSTARKGKWEQRRCPPRALWPFCPTVHQHSEQQLNLSCLSCHLLNSAEVAAQNIYGYRSQQSIVCNLSPRRTRSKPGQCSGISLASHPHSPTRGDWISNALCVVFKRHNTNKWHPRTRRLRGEGREQSSSDQRCPSRLAEPRPSGRSLERPIFTDLSTRK